MKPKECRLKIRRLKSFPVTQSARYVRSLCSGSPPYSAGSPPRSVRAGRLATQFMPWWLLTATSAAPTAASAAGSTASSKSATSAESAAVGSAPVRKATAISAENAVVTTAKVSPGSNSVGAALTYAVARAVVAQTAIALSDAVAWSDAVALADAVADSLSRITRP